jgi:hypothetical protein
MRAAYTLRLILLDWGIVLIATHVLNFLLIAFCKNLHKLQITLPPSYTCESQKATKR